MTFKRLKRRHLRTREDAEAERRRRRVPPGRPPDWTPGWDDVFIHIIPYIAWLVFLLISITVGLRVVNLRRVWRLLKQKKGAILVAWHGNIFLHLFALRHLGIHGLVSLSRDGEYLDKMFRLLGWNSIRGSTYAGPVKVLLAATRFVKQGVVLGLTPDGPRGPAKQVFPGTLYLASTSQCPILPMGAAMRPGWQLPTWDRAQIPKPFSVGTVVIGAPIYIPRKLDEATLARCTREVHDAIEQANREAEQILERQLAPRLYTSWNALAVVCSPLIAIYYVWRAVLRGKVRLGATQQLGWYPRSVAGADRLSTPAPGYVIEPVPSCCARPRPRLQRPPRIWLHAVSVGETMAASAILNAIREQLPGAKVIVSTATDAAQQTARGLLKQADDFVYYPLDAPQCVRRALNAVRPDIFLTVETELWPNFLHLAKQRGIPTMLVNGRFSENTLRTSQTLGPFWRWMMHNVDVFAMRSQTDFDRAAALGAPRDRLRLTGDCKLDQPVRLLCAQEVQSLRAELGLHEGERVFLAGSTHRGEEELLAAAWCAMCAHYPATRLILAPRHTDRIEEVEQKLAECGFATVRRSSLLGANGNGSDDGHAIILIDTIGELRRLYAVADVTFVGGSLIKRGGHNVLEPAIQGKPVLFGPNVDNFKDAVRLLLEAGVGWTVRTPEEIVAVSAELLNGNGRLAEIRAQALAALDRNRGAAAATVDMVKELLGMTA